ncbi:MAG: hypothetical protein P1V81_01305 [Planctomycetota bacterium]|nr:hypothetical protein [Planctomycetota bacterium]
MRTLLALLLPSLFLLPVLALAPLQDDRGPDEEPVWPRCIQCKTTGMEECPDKVHKKVDCGLETNAHYCSEVYGCETCGGTGWIDCDECERPDVDADLAGRRERIPGIRESVIKYDEEMGFPLHTIVTDHFEIVWEIDSMKVDKKRLDQHELMHLWADRMETLFADYVDTLQVKDGSFQQRLRLFVWWLPKDQKDGSLRFCQQGNEEGVKLLGLNPTYSLCGNKKSHKNDESLHRNVVHNVTHLLLSHQNPMEWIGNKKGGWADAGLAHWFEDKYFEVCDTYCYQEQNTNVDFKGGKWKPAVRKMVQSGDYPKIGTVFSRNTDGLELEEHAIAFSYVDFLIHKDAKMFNLLLSRLRSKTPTRDALAEAFGLSPIQMEEAWAEWVKDTYPLR